LSRTENFQRPEGIPVFSDDIHRKRGLVSNDQHQTLMGNLKTTRSQVEHTAVAAPTLGKTSRVMMELTGPKKKKFET